jgi:hypothetical protein
MSLFTGTAGFYRQYRPGIPATVADVLVATSPARRPHRLPDIGTGTSLAAEALLGSFDDVIAIDNHPGMLAAAEEELRPLVPASDAPDGRVNPPRTSARRQGGPPTLSWATCTPPPSPPRPGPGERASPEIGRELAGKAILISRWWMRSWPGAVSGISGA